MEFHKKIKDIEDIETLFLPFADDFHIHLRQGIFCDSLVKEIKKGGINRVLVMPNLNPPISSFKQVKEYYNKLKQNEPDVEYLMTMFLSNSINIDELEISKKEANMIGLKLYPNLVTTNSKEGINDIKSCYHIFSKMQELDLVLHIHGESPNSSVLDAESDFMMELINIHRDFPNLRIVLEHISTEDAVNTILKCNENVVATITPHHLQLTIDDVVNNSFNYCKPVAKNRKDREALRNIVKSGNKKFFLGSDSAPHPNYKKLGECCEAGIYTTPFLIPYLAHIFNEIGSLDKLENFVCKFGADFFKLPVKTEKHIKIIKKKQLIPNDIAIGLFKVVPFLSGKIIDYTLEFV